MLPLFYYPLLMRSSIIKQIGKARIEPVKYSVIPKAAALGDQNDSLILILGFNRFKNQTTNLFHF